MRLIKFILVALLVFYLLGWIGRLLFRWWIGRLQRDMQKKFGEGGGTYYRQYTWGRGARPEKPAPEGEVKVSGRVDPGRKRVNEKVGDYVDYEEVK